MKIAPLLVYQDDLSQYYARTLELFSGGRKNNLDILIIRKKQ